MYMTFSISTLVSARDFYIKPDSEAGVLIPGTIWKISCHNLFITYFTFTFRHCTDRHCLISFWNQTPTKATLLRIYFRNLSVQRSFLQYKSRFLKKVNVKIPIQHDMYILANYSVSSYLNLIPIFWNVLIWLKYDFMHIVMHHLSLYFDIYSLRPLRRYRIYMW
jgi:hypothetical protein